MQIFLSLCFAVIIYGGIVVPGVDAKLAGTLRNTNFAALLVWSLWWPLIIISAVLFGRIWCQVCPMELVSSLLSKIGLKRKVPSFFKTGWAITIFYSFVLLIIIRTFWAHRYPQRMAFFFLFLFGVTAVFGLIYEKRAFCNYICPVGHLLGLYALCSPLEWRAKNKEVCSSCKTKDCISREKSYTLTKQSCTSNLYPASIKDNRRCLLCTQCLKVCPYGNLRLSLRKPMADFFQSLKISSAEFFFILILSGLVIWEISEEWDAAEETMLYIPNQVNEILGASGELANIVHAIILFVFLPAIIFLIPSFLAKVTNKMSMFEAAKKFSIIILPVIATTHLLKALFKISSRIPYYELTIKDPLGLQTARLIASGDIQLDKSLVNFISPFLNYLTLFLFLGALISSWLIVLKSSSFKTISVQGKVPFLSVILIYCSIFLVFLIETIFWGL